MLTYTNVFGRNCDRHVSVDGKTDFVVRPDFYASSQMVDFLVREDKCVTETDWEHSYSYKLLLMMRSMLRQVVVIQLS